MVHLQVYGGQIILYLNIAAVPPGDPGYLEVSKLIEGARYGTPGRRSTISIV